MRFIRFVQARRHPESGVEDGLIGLAYELRDSPRVAAEDRAALADALMWFAKHLETPAGDASGLGYLLYVSASSLMALPVDAAMLEPPSHDPIRVIRAIRGYSVLSV